MHATSTRRPFCPPVPAALALTLTPDQRRRQVLYFMPAVRAAFLALAPDADAEFSLADELGLLFRMLAGGGPGPRAASNLLRAAPESAGGRAWAAGDAQAAQRPGALRPRPAARGGSSARAADAPERLGDAGMVQGGVCRKSTGRRTGAGGVEHQCLSQLSIPAAEIMLPAVCWQRAPPRAPGPDLAHAQTASPSLSGTFFYFWHVAVHADCGKTDAPPPLRNLAACSTCLLEPGAWCAGLRHRGGDHQGPLPGAALPVAAALPAGAAAPRARATCGRRCRARPWLRPCHKPPPWRGTCREPRRRAACCAGRQRRPGCRHGRRGGRLGRGRRSAWAGRARIAQRGAHGGSRAAVGARRSVRRGAGAGAGRTRDNGSGAALPAQRAPAHAVPIGHAPGQAGAGAPARVPLSARLSRGPLPRCLRPAGRSSARGTMRCSMNVPAVLHNMQCICMDWQHSSVWQAGRAGPQVQNTGNLAVACAPCTALPWCQQQASSVPRS